MPEESKEQNKLFGLLAMKVKTKLYLVLASFFCIVMLTGIVGLFAIDRLANESKNILKANYESIEYTAGMQQGLDRFEDGKSDALDYFQKNLALQESNITEPGEKEITSDVREMFEKLKLNNTSLAIVKELREGVYKINDINLNAIAHKNEETQKTAEKLKIYLAILVSISFFVSLIFLISIPGYIANPIQKHDLAKTNFIATVSHALKTPIASIKMSLKLLGDDRVGSTNTEQKQLINYLKEDSERLLNITSELLNMTQVETGNIQLNFRQTNPKEIVDYSVDTVKMQAEQKHVALEVICPENLHKVSVDTEKTVWVLVNLLSNALRYSPESNKIIIQVAENGSSVEFSVKDFGIGIEDKYKERLFQRYFQVPGSARSGTGLGLAISKEFIEAQNGKIGVESTVGHGSRFYFTLPIV